MALVGPRASILDLISAIDLKIDSKQATFHVPTSFLPIARQVFLKRYMCEIEQRDNVQC